MNKENTRQKDPSLVRAIEFKAMMYGIEQKAIWDTDTFKRFMKTPSWLAVALSLTMFASLMVLWGNISNWTQTIVTGFFILPYVAICALISYNIGLFSFNMAMRSRLHKWVKYKFSSGDDLKKWAVATSSKELEFAAGLPDEAWEPDLELNGIKMNAGFEKELDRFKLDILRN